MVKFDSFNLPQDILSALADMGFEEASPIQEAVIPALLDGRDVIGQAQTGTGKTAAFGIPLVMAADQGRPGLVLCPTRELAQQVSAEIDRIGAKMGVKSVALYGGAAFGPQARAIQQGDFSIVVATPGRLRDHFERGTLDPSSAAIVVLDEADEMLKMGFAEEVEAILDAVGPNRQTLLFSATMPDRIVHLAQTHMKDPEHVAVAGENDSLAAAVIALGASLALDVVAEGIEYPEQASSLRELGCELGQGFLFARPMAHDALHEYLEVDDASRAGLDEQPEPHAA